MLLNFLCFIKKVTYTPGSSLKISAVINSNSGRGISLGGGSNDDGGPKSNVNNAGNTTNISSLSKDKTQDNTSNDSSSGSGGGEDGNGSSGGSGRGSGTTVALKKSTELNENYFNRKLRHQKVG